ncbi:MAG: PEP-CTERM sorting domain-containing protein [Planctomycetota bacterium]
MELRKTFGFTTTALLAAATVAPAFAKTNEVNSTGATLFRGFYEAPAQGSDFIDADGDGNTTDLGVPTVDLLFNSAFVTQARGIGSGNGFQELINFGGNNGPGADWSTGAYDSNDYATRNGLAVTPSSAFTGDVVFDVASVDVPSTFFATNTQAAPFWGNSPTTGGNATFGYGSGNNDSFANTASPQGALAAGGRDNGLADLTAGAVDLNLNQATPNRQTLFDTTIAWTPIAYFANYGAQIDSNADAAGGEGEIKKSELQHLYLTGRASNGENLVAVTRDSGSGTRNGAANSISIDPSWANGDNVGEKSGSGDSQFDRLGPEFNPTNKGGSSRMEGTTQNHRLAVGYSGLADGPSTSRAGDDSVDGDYHLLAIMNDIDTDDNGVTFGSQYVYPTFGNTSGDAAGNNVVFNGDVNTGYRSGGSQTFVTEGDPVAGDIWFNSGTGEAVFDDSPAGPGAGFTLVSAGTGANDGDANVYMFSAHAALYMRNIIESLQSATLTPTTDPTGTPGDFLASSFALVAGTQALPDTDNTGDFIANPSLNNSLINLYQSTPSELPSEVLSTQYGPDATNGNRYGKYPDRTDVSGGTFGITEYSDGQNGTNGFVTNDGLTNVSEGASMVVGNAVADRNAIAGDFDGDGDRDIDDIDNMVFAYLNSLEAGASSTPDAFSNTLVSRDGALAAADANGILEVLGDFNGDGSFDIDDVLYGTDGLFAWGRAGDTVDRYQNFVDVDNATPGGNLFNVTLANGTYDAGNSAGDLDGVLNAAPGFAPEFGDGVVNAADIDALFSLYVGIDQDGDGVVFGIAPEFDQLEVAEMILSNLSGDLTGDLIVGEDDAAFLVNTILETNFGDANLDGSVDLLDFDALAGAFGGAGGWATGDFNGDGAIDLLDFDGLAANFGSTAPPATVPEPASLALLGLAGLATLRRRRA